MGQRGSLPSQLPGNVRKLKASSGSVRSESGAKAPVARPVAPADLSPAEVVYWERVVADLEPIGLLARSDAHLLTQFVRSAVLADEAWGVVKADGVVVDSSHGARAKNPAIQVWRDAVSKMESVGKVLGLSPEARLRMPRVEPVFDDDDLD